MTQTKIEDMNCFPTLVRKISNFLSVEECAEIASKIDRTTFLPHPALAGNGALSDYNSRKFKGPYALDDIETYLPVIGNLMGQVGDYLSTYGLKQVRLANSWFNIQQKDSELVMHTHPLSSVSGALYIQVDGSSSSIMFSNPNPFIEFTDIESWTPYTFKTAWVPPKTGDLILFPSWLRHGSNSKNQSNERIVLSFNTNTAVV